jgi:hypothetical protein
MQTTQRKQKGKVRFLLRFRKVVKDRVNQKEPRSHPSTNPFFSYLRQDARKASL